LHGLDDILAKKVGGIGVQERRKKDKAGSSDRRIIFGTTGYLENRQLAVNIKGYNVT
jgi:hypothetical protein